MPDVIVHSVKVFEGTHLDVTYAPAEDPLNARIVRLDASDPDGPAMNRLALHALAAATADAVRHG